MLWCIPALPLAAFFLLIAFGCAGPLVLSFIGVSFIFLSFIASVVFGIRHWEAGLHEVLWSWIPQTDLAFVLDPLSLLMILVITFVAFLVALYSSAFMGQDPGLGRFFAYLNLFVAAMLVLVLADNLLLLFAGWEGVGLCSYLLIGFWYEKPETSIAANKAFIMTRIGDVFLLLGIIYLGLEFKTLTISVILPRISEQWPIGSFGATMAALCLLLGAIGKSAQIPLHTWLPDAMLGPTPASALIHAATMVTAGVYLMARMASLFALAPDTQQAVIIIGALTLVLGSFCALRQNDLKRVLAYSTISQIGYMFLALGVGSPGAAMFHFTTHAFFKALLFMGAGVIGEALHHEYNIFKMGGLRKELPLTYYTFLMGSASLAGLPLISAGFYSKELILGEAFSSSLAGIWPWIMGCLGAFLTALYVGRMIILVFFGKAHTPVSLRPTWLMTVPLVVLGILSLGAGLIQTPLLDALGFTHHPINIFAYVSASLIPIVGLLLSWMLYKKASAPNKILVFIFDRFYNFMLIKPYIKLANFLKSDFFIFIYSWIVRFINLIYQLLSHLQNGRIEHYLAVVVACILTALGFLVLS